jgi:AraC-like DNA-binding protein
MSVPCLLASRPIDALFHQAFPRLQKRCACSVSFGRHSGSQRGRTVTHSLYNRFSCSGILPVGNRGQRPLPDERRKCPIRDGHVVAEAHTHTYIDREAGITRVMADHTVPAQMVHLILEGLVIRGSDIDSVLHRAGISPALLESATARVSTWQYAGLMRTLRRVTRDELWGLCSRPVPPGTFATACAGTIHCRTLGDAIMMGLGHYRLFLADFSPRLYQDKAAGDASIRLNRRLPPSGPHDFVGATFLFHLAQVASWLIGQRIPIRRVEIARPQASRQDMVAKLLDAPVQYGAPSTALHFDARWLSRPVIQNPGTLADFLSQVPRNLILPYRNPVSAGERVRNSLKPFLGGPLPDLSTVAGQLNISPATLRRRLRDEGLHFQQIKDELRRDAAVAQLLHGHQSITAVAGHLGFSEASTFHRAFKQWTGVSPGEYRQRQSA